MTRFQKHSVLMSLLILGGCTPTIAMDSADFGDAVRHNIAVQTVNPSAPNDKGPIEASGARAALAQQRYETDKVEPPSDISSTRIRSSGGSGSGEGSSSSGGN